MKLNRIKILGITIGVMASASAFASAAQAAPEFHCGGLTSSCFVKTFGGTHGTGSNDNVWNISGGNMKCTGNSEVDGVQLITETPMAKDSSELYVAATYTGCKSFGVTTKWKMEGCRYRYTLGSGGPGTYPVTWSIVCPEGKAITLSPVGLNCTTVIWAQSGLTGITMSNVAGSPKTLSATLAVEGISYTKYGTECPEGAGSGTNGKMEGTFLLKGFESNKGVMGNPVDLTVG
jgi:hypothetical protein